MIAQHELGITYIYFVLWIAAYMLPTIIAALRNHHNGCAIVVLNIVLGWTLIGWCLALVWSFTRVERKAQ